MAATFPLIYLFASRMFGLNRISSAGLAFVLSTLPSMVFFSQFALTDALLPAVVMTLLLLLYGMFTAAAVTARGGASGARRRGFWWAGGHRPVCQSAVITPLD